MNWASWMRALRKVSGLVVLAALPVGACSAGGVDDPGAEPTESVAQQLCQADGCPACKVCINGTCQPDTGESCINGGICAGNGACCSGCLGAGNVCQTGTSTASCGKGDYCSVCDTANQCQTNACSAGTCTTPKVADNTPCTGGKCLGGNCCTGCMSGTTCAAGTDKAACGKAGGTCSNCDTGNECLIGSCSNGACSTTAALPGTPCGGGTGKCANGACCKGCWDGVTCQLGTALGVCGKGGAACTSCSDTNDCSTDGCTAGVCTHDAIPGCSDGKCGGATPLDCNDKKPCTTDTCDPITGCVHTNAEGIDCDDGNPCTQHDSCSAGACKSGPELDCAPSDECHDAGACEPASGKCTNPAKKDGTKCTGGTCQGGKCVAGGSGGEAGASEAGAGEAGASTAGASGESGATGEGGTNSRAGSAGKEQGGDATTGGGDVGSAGVAGLYTRDPGGCSCRTGNEQRRSGTVLFSASLVLLALVRRRRVQRARSAG